LRRSSISRLRSTLRASPCDEARDAPPPRQDTHYNGLFKAAIDPAQDAFFRIDVHPCGWTGIVRDSCSFTRTRPTPFRATRACPPCLRKSCRATLPCALLDRLAAHLDHAWKMRLTDVCNRHSIRAPVNRSTLEPAALAAMTTSAMRPEREPRCHPDGGVGPPCGNPAPSRAALDGAPPASDE